MPLVIEDDEACQLAATLARRTGEPMQQAVLRALRERVERVGDAPRSQDLVAFMLGLGAEVAALPVLDARPVDELLGYDEHGLPG